RFRDVPTFGRDSIRRFANSVSELKKLGARDYENLLQARKLTVIVLYSDPLLCLKCSIPVFEGLLPEPHNTHVLNVLFALAHWHALAKLRQHTDQSLIILESATVKLGELLRIFQAKTCAAYHTRELPRETAARLQKAASKLLPSKPAASDRTNAASKAKSAAGRQLKNLNLKTYKDHSLGDYVESIRRNGTVDSYSTESASHTFIFAYLLHYLLHYRWNWNTAVPNRAISEQAAKVLKNNWVILSAAKLAFVASATS
ncbi:hypothetical protein HYPSUDRAFT_1084937, partial [Hypholoma sublateritium FD-334 SS-4]